jgi:hypothetical protein
LCDLDRFAAVNLDDDVNSHSLESSVILGGVTLDDLDGAA